MMRASLSAALAAAMLAAPAAIAQESAPVWQKIGDVGPMAMEIDPASHKATGAAHRVRVRMSAPTSNRAMVINLLLDCGKKTMAIEGQTELYVDGAFSEKLTPPAGVSATRPAESDDIGKVAYTYYCKPQ